MSPNCCNIQALGRRLSRVAIGLGVTVLVVQPFAAHADERTDARRAFRAGMEAIEAGQYEAGIAELERAYEILPKAPVLYNIGRAHLDAEHYPEAIEYFRRYLETDPPDADAVELVLNQVEAIAEQAAQKAADQVQQASSEESTGELSATGLAILESTLQQILAIAEVTQSVALGQKAQELEDLIESLRSGRPPEKTLAEADPAPELPDEPESEQATATEAEPETQDKTELGAPEASTEVYQERVVTASRFSSSSLAAPNSTTIVTAQDIRLSGIRNLAELLRRAAGVEVMTLTTGDTQVSIRGLNQRLSNKVLILVNGRSVFLDFIGATLWHTIPVSLETIERIEIIRGPASAIYGADALTGVINIVLESPGEAESLARASVGEGNTYRLSAVSSGRSETGLRYTLSAGYDRSDNYSLSVDPARVDLLPYAEDPNLGLERTYGTADLGYRSRGGWTFSGSGRALTGVSSFIGTITLRELYLDELLSSQAHVQVNSPFGLSARVFWNHFRASGGPTESPVGAISQDFEDLRSDVVDAEVVYQGSFDFLVKNELALGTSYRLKNIDWVEYLREERTQNHFAAFFEDNLRFSRAASLLLSARVDRHPLFDQLQFSPRGSFVYRPADDSAIRLVVGRAFRNPTFTESYVQNRTPIAQGRGVTAFGVGNEDLAPESLIAYEVGYAQNFDRFSLEVNAYYNRFSNAILNQGRVSPTLSDNGGFIDDVDAFLVREVTFVNDEATFRQIGGELGVRAYPVDGLDLYANLSLHDTSPTSSSRELDLEGREDDERTSRYKVNAGLQYRSEIGLDVGVDLNVVGEQFWVIRTSTATGFAQQGTEIPAYTLLNARIGYRLFDDQLELAVSGTNLLDDVHRQHPFSAQRLTRRVFVTSILRF